MSTLDDQMQADALEAQKFSRKHLVLELDFSPGSVAELEQQADTVEYAVRGGKSDENIDMLARIWGAYIGEALRKKCGGAWTSDESGRIGLKGENSTAYPQDAVRSRLTDGGTNCLSTYFEQTSEQL